MKVRDAVEVARILAEKRRHLVNRTEIVSLRLTKDEKAMLQRMATTTGDVLSAFIREAALDVARALIKFDGGEPEA